MAELQSILQDLELIKQLIREQELANAIAAIENLERKIEREQYLTERNSPSDK